MIRLLRLSSEKLRITLSLIKVRQTDPILTLFQPLHASLLYFDFPTILCITGLPRSIMPIFQVDANICLYHILESTQTA